MFFAFSCVFVVRNRIAQVFLKVFFSLVVLSPKVCQLNILKACFTRTLMFGHLWLDPIRSQILLSAKVRAMGNITLTVNDATANEVENAVRTSLVPWHWHFAQCLFMAFFFINMR